MNYFFNKADQASRNTGMNVYGDLSPILRKTPVYFEDRMKALKRFNNIERTILGKDKDLIMKQKAEQKKSERLQFLDGFKSKLKMRGMNIDRFIDDTSYFKKSNEEIVSMYHAIEEPDKFSDIRELMGLSEDKYSCLTKKEF